MSVADDLSGEVRGETVNPCIEGVMSVFQDRMRNILDDHGIEQPDPQPDEWYPMSKFVRVLDVVGTDVGENAQEKIGEATPQFINWPTQPDSPADALERLIDAFDNTHRNVDGDYSFYQTDDGEGRITSTTPYPEMWEKGMLKGAAEEHGAAYASVEIVDDTDHGKKLFEISW
jgi:hypothetical protein